MTSCCLCRLMPGRIRSREQPAYDHAIAAAIARRNTACHRRLRRVAAHADARSSAMRVPRDVVLAGPDAYETYLREHARPDWDTPVPEHRVPGDNPAHAGGADPPVCDTGQPDSATEQRPRLPARGRHLRRGIRRHYHGARVMPSEYRVIERDYRTEPLVHAHGRFCCLDEDAFAATGELRTTSLPVHRQMVYESRPELQPSFAELAADPVPVLERIEDHMNAVRQRMGQLPGDRSARRLRPARLRSRPGCVRRRDPAVPPRPAADPRRPCQAPPDSAPHSSGPTRPWR